MDLIFQLFTKLRIQVPINIFTQTSLDKSRLVENKGIATKADYLQKLWPLFFTARQCSEFWLLKKTKLLGKSYARLKIGI